MDKVKLTINGQSVECSEGKSVLDAALDAGIYIPHLCSHPNLPAQGNCKLCVVEVNGSNKLVCACETIVQDGMEVITDSDNIFHARTVAMELMLAGHPEDCESCKLYLKCELQSVIQYLGTAHSRMRTIHKETCTVNINNPLIVREMERCILCGRCIRACKDLRGVGILQYNRRGDEVYVGTENDLPLAEAGCSFCGACVEVCPTGALQDETGVFRDDLPKKEALVPCQAECPAHIDIPAYIRAVKEQRYSDAVGIIREKVPFPHALGYICNNRCEEGCKHCGLNSAISIRNLKRFAAEHDTEQKWMQAYLTCKPDTGKKVAVVGSGPAGLTAAFYLRKSGHEVTVYEAEKTPGGQMTFGIPEYRLPTETVLQEIEIIEKCGVKICCGCKVDNVLELRQNYDAVLVALGTGKGKKLSSLPGAEFSQVYSAMDVLKSCRSDEKPDLGDVVTVIGGGNVAFDVAGALIRMNKKVNLVCLEKGAYQASADERDLGLEEGIELFDGYSNEEILGTQAQVTGLRVHRINRFRFDPENGNLIEDAVPDSTQIIPTDSIVFAAGQVPDIPDNFGIELNRFGYPLNPDSSESFFSTSEEGIFAAGDVITGTKFVINAIAHGRQAASCIDVYLGGSGEIDETLVQRERNPEIGKVEGFAAKERQDMQYVPAEERKNNNLPISKGFTTEQAVFEAGRCLQCDLRNDIERVRLWTEFGSR